MFDKVVDGVLDKIEDVYDMTLNVMYPSNSGSLRFTQESFYTWRIFGSPYMLLDDPPLGQVSNSGFLGEWYINQLRQSQILTMKIGIPRYTGNRKAVGLVDYVNGAAQAINQGKGTVDSITDSALSALTMKLNDLDSAKRYYIFWNQYEVYLQYVRMNIVTMASYLGVMDYPIPVLTEGGKGASYSTISGNNWTTYTTSGNTPQRMSDVFENAADWLLGNSEDSLKQFVSNSADIIDSMDSPTIRNYTSTYYEVAGGPPAVVQFVIQPSYAVDNFNNTTAPSLLQNIADSASQIGREVAWVSSTGGSSSFTEAVSNIVSTGAQGVQEALDSMHMDPAASMFGSSIVGLLRGLTGERMIYPEIYDNSKFSKSMNYTVKLVSPYGDNYSYFMNIGLPLCYLLPMVAPRTTSVNAYRMPFMCQAYVTGQTAMPMAIVENMTISRGTNGAMNKDGLPLEVDVNIGIKDLYSVLAVSSISDPAQFLSNDSLVEYLASFTAMETWNKSRMNSYMTGSIGDAVKEDSFDADKILDRQLNEIAEFAGDQLRLYGILDASR